MCKVSLSC